MTIWIFDVMWTLMLFGVALFTGCCIVFNPAIRGIRTMGILSSYAVGIWMLIVLPAKIAIGTWCVFASAGGVIAFAYELWARRRYAAAGRKPRPLILLQGFILWPGMIPDAIEGVLVDTGILEPSGPREANGSTETKA
ncbi:MAG: hypothetical protein NTZ43_14250 [Gemmatimonadetes bacterium]|nr:hypothetical protein [Gemmatimonadota bacterium]